MGNNNTANKSPLLTKLEKEYPAFLSLSIIGIYFVKGLFVVLDYAYVVTGVAGLYLFTKRWKDKNLNSNQKAIGIIGSVWFVGLLLTHYF